MSPHPSEPRSPRAGRVRRARRGAQTPAATTPASAGGAAPSSGSLPDPLYGRSALVAAVPRMIRTTSPAVPAIVLVALVQAGLMYLNAQSGLTPSFLVSFAVSAAVTLLLYAVLAACALVDADSIRRGALGPAELPLRRVRANLGRFTFWIALQWLAIVLASLVSAWLVPLVALVTPYLPLAAMDGRGNALGVNLLAIRQRAGRWAATCLALLLLGLLLFLLSVANTLLVQGTPASFVFWATIGVVAWWVLTAWALIYRSTSAATIADPDA